MLHACCWCVCVCSRAVFCSQDFRTLESLFLAACRDMTSNVNEAKIPDHMLVGMNRAVLLAFGTDMEEIKWMMGTEFGNVITCLEFAQRLHSDCKSISHNLSLGVALLEACSHCYETADEEFNYERPLNLVATSRYNPSATPRPMQTKLEAVCGKGSKALELMVEFEDAAAFMAMCPCFNEPCLEGEQLCALS